MDQVLLGKILAGLMFVGVIGFLMLGFPVAFTLAGTSILFAVAGLQFGVVDMTNLRARRPLHRLHDQRGAGGGAALHLHGVMLERSKIAEQLLSTMGRLFGNMRGGLGISVVLVGALLAASTGVVGATVVTMGLISLPAMLRAGYDPKLACGTICASGTLGQIIPPSTVLIFMGDMIAGMHSQVQMSLGNFAPQTVSVGDLFAGAMIPGFLLVGLYLLYILVMSLFRPEGCPATPVPPDEKRGLWKEVLVAFLPPLLLIIAVLGSILGGIATPTEAASVGAVGATLLAALRWRLSLGVLVEVARRTAVITSMIFIILFGASVFAIVFRQMGGDSLVHEFLAAMPGGATGAMITVMIIMFVLGFMVEAEGERAGKTTRARRCCLCWSCPITWCRWPAPATPRDGALSWCGAI